MSSTNPANSLPKGMAEKLAGSDVEPPKDWSQYGFPQFLKDNLASLGATRPTMAQAELLAMLGQADFDSFVTTQLEGETTLGICLSVIVKAYRRFAKKKRCLDEVQMMTELSILREDLQSGRGSAVDSNAPHNSDDTFNDAAPRVNERDRRYPMLPSSVVLCPTKEGAEKTFSMLQSLTDKGPVETCIIIDGNKNKDELRQFDKGCDIIVATPLELISIVEDGHLELYGPDIAVLDGPDWLLGSDTFNGQLEKLWRLGILDDTTSLGFVCKFYTEAIHKDVLAFRDRSELPLITTTFAHDPVPNLERQLTGEFEYMEEVPSYHHCGKNWNADHSTRHA